MPRTPVSPEPGHIPRSPSGRIPEWVLDEAMGKTVAPVPFRGYTVPLLRPRASRARRAFRLVVVLLLVTAVGVGVFHFRGQLSALGAAPGAPVAASGPPAGYEEDGAPLGSPPDVPALPEGAAYRFSVHQQGTEDPVTWSPCRPIHYVVRPDHEPPGGADLLRQAVASTSRATGLRFVDDGPTDEAPSADRAPYQPGRYGDRWAPVLIAWATPDEVPDFGVDVAGEAGPVRMSTPAGEWTYVSGAVYLDPTKLASAALTDVATARVIVVHELGHLVGLAHVADPGAVMFPRASAGVTEYGPGDSAGLAALGRGQCQPSV